MLNLTKPFIWLMNHREYETALLHRNDVRDLLLETADPAQRAGLLFRLARVEDQLEPLAFQLHGSPGASWHCDASTMWTYAALAEQALYEARWTTAADLKAEDTLWRHGEQRRILAVAAGERLGGRPARIVLACRGRDGEVREELGASELVQTRSTTASPALKALTDGASPAEVDLWDQLTRTPDRIQRAAIYRRLAQLPGVDGEPLQGSEILEDLALAEEHLTPGTPRHPHLVAAEREERRARLGEWALLSAVLCALLIELTDEQGPLFWLVFLSGLGAAVALRFGAHEALGRLVGRGGR